MTSPAIPPRPSALPPNAEQSRRQPLSGEQHLLQIARPHSIPKIWLRIEGLDHPGSKAFLAAINLKDPEHIVSTVINILYESGAPMPPARSITFVVRPMDGVAYTRGSDLDDEHKEIHFSVHHFADTDESRRVDEVLGVLTHELVHCVQWNAVGTCPGGLVEGIADWVRLRAGYIPPHWKPDPSGEWDSGYERTGYFLDFLDTVYGDGTVRRINQTLRHQKYDEDTFWPGLFGKGIKDLWKSYTQTFPEENDQ
jgi:hypothetical protein